MRFVIVLLGGGCWVVYVALAVIFFLVVELRVKQSLVLRLAPWSSPWLVGFCVEAGNLHWRRQYALGVSTGKAANGGLFGGRAGGGRAATTALWGSGGRWKHEQRRGTDPRTGSGQRGPLRRSCRRRPCGDDGPLGRRRPVVRPRTARETANGGLCGGRAGGGRAATTAQSGGGGRWQDHEQRRKTVSSSWACRSSCQCAEARWCSGSP